MILPVHLISGGDAMSLLQGLIRGILDDFLPCGNESDVKIQVRKPDELIWRDHSFVSDNPDAVQNGLYAASLSADGGPVRAVGRSGRTVDFR